MGDMFAVGQCDCNCNPVVCGTCCITCNPCVIPPVNLTLKWTSTVYGNGSALMTFGISSWSVSNVIGGLFTFTLDCFGGNVLLLSSPSRTLAITSYTCNAFDFLYTSTASEFQTLEVIGVPYGSGNCCQTFTVEGCTNQQIYGLTINVYDYSGVSLLTSGATGSQGLGVGKVNLIWSGSCNVYVTITDPNGRFASYGNALSLTSGQNQTIHMTLATGYYCYTGSVCAWPLPSTLHSTFANAGAQVFTYASGKWTASFIYLTVTYVINLATNGTMTATANGVGFTCTFTLTQCPVGPFIGSIAVPISGTGSPIGNGSMTE